MVQEEDTQLLTEPIVAPIKERKYNIVEKDDKLPVTRFDKKLVASSVVLFLSHCAGQIEGESLRKASRETRRSSKLTILPFLPSLASGHSFLLDMMHYPEMMRNVVVAGHLHHGKTALLDMLILETHQLTWDADTPVSPLPPLVWLAASLDQSR